MPLNRKNCYDQVFSKVLLGESIPYAEEADAVRKRKKVTRTQRHQSKQQCMEGTPTQDKIL